MNSLLAHFLLIRVRTLGLAGLPGLREPLMGRAKKSDSIVKVCGIITPSEWDEENNVTSVNLSMADEREYLVQQDNKGRQLLRFLQKEVEVTGLIEEDPFGKKKIRILSYEIKRDL